MDRRSHEGDLSHDDHDVITVQSQAAARVATKRAARVAAGTTSDADVQRSLLAKIRAAGGSIPAVEPAPGA